MKHNKGLSLRIFIFIVMFLSLTTIAYASLNLSSEAVRCIESFYNGCTSCIIEVDSTCSTLTVNGDLDVTGALAAGSLAVLTLEIADLDASNYLALRWNENDVSDRILNFLVNSGDRSLSMSGNLTVEADSLIDQDLTRDSGDVQFARLTMTGTLTMNSNVNINFSATNEVFDSASTFSNDGDGAVTYAPNRFISTLDAATAGDSLAGSVLDVVQNNNYTLFATDNQFAARFYTGSVPTADHTSKGDVLIEHDLEVQGSIFVPILVLDDTGGDHTVTITLDEDLTANETLKIDINDADAKLYLEGLTCKLNQDLTTDADGNLQSLTVTKSEATDFTGFTAYNSDPTAVKTQTVIWSSDTYSAYEVSQARPAQTPLGLIKFTRHFDSDFTTLGGSDSNVEYYARTNNVLVKYMDYNGGSAVLTIQKPTNVVGNLTTTNNYFIFSADYVSGDFLQARETPDLPPYANYTNFGHEIIISEGPTNDDFELTIDLPVKYVDPTRDTSVREHPALQFSHDLAGKSLNIMTDPRLLIAWHSDPSIGVAYDLHTSQNSSDVHNGTFHGAMTSRDLQYANDGLVYVLTLDGIDDYVSFGDHADFSFNGTADKAFSIEVWVEVTNQATSQIIISKWNETTGTEDREYKLYLDSHEVLHFELYDESQVASCKPTIYTNASLSIGMHHIIATYSGIGTTDADDGLELHVDGFLLTAVTRSGTQANYGDMVAGASPLWVGSQEGTGGTVELFFKGDVGLVGITQEEYLVNDPWKLYQNARGSYGQ